MRRERETTPQPAGQWDPLAGRWTEPRFGQANGGPRRRSATLRAGIIGGVIGAVVASLIVIPVVRRTGSTVIERRVSAGPATARNPRLSVVDIAKTARPWVVNLDVKRPGGFLGSQTVRGSGVILRSDGFILTSAHVVENASTIEVTLASSDKLRGRLVGTDDDTDVGVIKVDRQRLHAAVLGSAKQLRVGDIAVAIGSPLGLEQTVTEGIISALGRTVRPSAASPPLVEMIQTDAPITHGNSGGALINGDGAVIGINTAIATQGGAAEGIAFATPIDIAATVARELIATGHATHPWLGVTGTTITSASGEKFGVSDGALMVQVLPGAPAGRAGIRPDDVIVKFDKERIKSMDELVVAIRSHKVGQRVAIEVVRKKKHMNFNATLAEKPRGR